MTEEQINTMAEEYIKDCDPMFRKAMKAAYIEGALNALKYIKDKLMEL